MAVGQASIRVHAVAGVGRTARRVGGASGLRSAGRVSAPSRSVGRQPMRPCSALTFPSEPDILMEPLMVSKDSKVGPALLVIASTVALGPSKYQTLAALIQGITQFMTLLHGNPTDSWTYHRAQEMVGNRVPLVVALVQIGWQAVLEGATGPDGAVDNAKFWRLAAEQAPQDIGRALQAAEGRGLLPGVSPSGRNERVFVAGHSGGGQILLDYALKRSGGLILLGSRMEPSARHWAGVGPWARPVLQVLAELDGQLRCTRGAPWAVESAAAAAKLGTLAAAAAKPVVVMPGMSHAQFADGVRNAARGDLEPDISLEAAQQNVAQVVGDFLSAHLGVADSAAAATGRLRDRAVASAELLSPFTTALGRGDIGGLWRAVAAAEAASGEEGLGGDVKRGLNPPGILPGGILAHACGAELLDEQQPTRRWFAHPGEVAAAERFAADAQQAALSVLGPEALARVRVVPTVVTDLTTFLYTQPTVTALLGGRVRVNVRCYMWREWLESTDFSRPQIAPQYWLKMRRPEAVALALGIADGGALGAVSDALSAATINAATMATALSTAGSAAKERYERCGAHLHFAPDCDVTATSGAEGWVLQERIIFKAQPEGGVVATSPIVRTEPRQLERYDSGAGLFAGNMYMKCLSPAGCQEWIMVDAFKPWPLAVA